MGYWEIEIYIKTNESEEFIPYGNARTGKYRDNYEYVKAT